MSVELRILRDMLNELAGDIHDTAIEKGFWESPRNDGECIALIHSEFSEALEGIRHGNPADQHCPEFGNVEIEIADGIIRALDYCAARKYDIGGAILAKMAFNETRPHKHGKEF